MPWKTKLLILHDVAACEPIWGKDPLQFVSDLFSIRDKLAHGKAETVLGPPFPTEIDAEAWENQRNIKPDWLAKVDRAWITSARRKHDEFMVYLATMCGVAPLDYVLTATTITGPHKTSG